MVAMIVGHRAQGAQPIVRSPVPTTSPNSSRWEEAQATRDASCWGSVVIESMLSAQTTVDCPRPERGLSFLSMAAPSSSGLAVAVGLKPSLEGVGVDQQFAA
jgi:hypothetical protein